MKRNEYRILFTSVGRRVELVQAFKKAADAEKIKLKIYAADMSENAPALYFCDEARKICRIKDEQYIPELIRICENERIDLLIPTIDTDLLILSENKDRFEKIGTKVLISSLKMVQLCRDKRFTGDFFERCGLSAPKAFGDYKDYNMGFPCFIKPKDGSSSINAFKVSNQQELEELADKVADYVVQPFIEGTEYTIDVFCDFEGNPVFITPRERIAVRSGEVLQTKIVEDAEMVEECKKLIEKFRPCGPITVQLIKDKDTGKNYYIEINPRYGGGAPLSIKAGADSPRVLLQLLQNKMIETDLSAARPGKIYSRFDQSIDVTRNRGSIAKISDLTEVKEFIQDIKAVIFDLDDTLYNECDYVLSGYECVAQYLTDKRLMPLTKAEIVDCLYKAFLEKKAAFDVLFQENNIEDIQLKNTCIKIYRGHVPQITLSMENKQLLQELHNQGKKIAVITDGRPDGQMNKIQALDLLPFIDEYIITDTLAGNSDVTKFRKPNPLAFQIMQKRFDLEYDMMAYVGDNISKDFQAPISLGMLPIWYQNKKGLYYDENTDLNK